MCKNRHPKICKFFEKYQRCKFGNYCHYSHHMSLTKNRRSNEIVKDINVLEKRIDYLEEEIKTLKNVIESSKIKEVAKDQNDIKNTNETAVHEDKTCDATTPEPSKDDLESDSEEEYGISVEMRQLLFETCKKWEKQLDTAMTAGTHNSND